MRILLGLVLVLALAGCAREAADPGTPDPLGEPVVHPSWESCESQTLPEGPGDGLEALAMPRLSDDFTPVAAITCVIEEDARPGGGTDLVEAEKRTDDVAALVTALRLPDQDLGTDPCTMELRPAPWLALIDAEGRWVRAGVPVDACGKPRFEVVQAHRDLVFTPVRKRKLSQMQSDAAATAGCSQSYADMTWVSGEMTFGRGPAPDLGMDDQPVRRCVYDVPEAERGNGKPGGQFVSGDPLPAGAWAQIKKELADAPPAEPCGTPATGFAVLHFAPNGTAYVERDGCERALLADNLAPVKGSDRLRELVFTK